MDVREQPTADEVARLRAAIYRRDPPAGAVDAYLDAVALLLPPPAPADLPPDPPVRSRRRTLAVLATGAVLVAAVPVLLAARETPAPAEPPRVASAVIEFPSVPGSEIGAMSGGPAASRAFDAGGGRVVVSVLCDRDGTLTLRIGPDPATVLTCQVGPPALAMIPSLGRLDAFTVSIAPNGPIRWSATVGAQR